VAAEDREWDREAMEARWMVSGLADGRVIGWRSAGTVGRGSEGYGWQIENDFVWRTSDLVAVPHPSQLRVKIRRGWQG
jgi:hypothetical protein